MSRLATSTMWSRDPQVPTTLNPGNEPGEICSVCGLNSIYHPIHCIVTASPVPHSNPRAASSTTSSRHSAASSSHERKPPIPVLRLETPTRWYRPQPPRPALRFDVQSNEHGRARARARRTAFSPLSPAIAIHDDDPSRGKYTSGSSFPNPPADDTEDTTNRKTGLDIPEGPFNHNPSPVRSPGSEQLAAAEKGEPPNKKESTSNIVEGIEKKLFKYSTSSSIVKRWLLETISWLLSALCMSAIIVLLATLQDKAVPKQWPLNITLNAYIAILSGIASASLMLPVSEALGQLKWIWFRGRSKKMWDFEIFDNASRGPWGSIMLLIRTKGVTLAALGAAITIFVIAIDPFFQRVVRYPIRTVPGAESSSISVVTNYEIRYSRKYRLDAELFNQDRKLYAVAERFFFDVGIPEVAVGNGSRAEVPLTCPTTNCTWEPYETLGVCSQCVDVVDMLDFGCYPAKFDWIQSATSYNIYSNGSMCGWFFNATSENRMLMLGYEVDPLTNMSSGEVLMTRALPLITNISRKRLFGGSINFKDIRNPITDFVIVSTEDGPDQDRQFRSIFEHQKPRALECVLSWCVKTIQSSYQQGAYTETVLDRFVNTTEGPFPWTLYTNYSRTHNESGTLAYLQDITVDPHSSGDQANVSTFRVSNDTAIGVVTVFDDFLPSMVTMHSNDSKRMVKYMTYEVDPWRQEYPTNPWSAPNNITRHMERLADVMSNAMRDAGNTTVLGNAFIEESYIEVRWGWLSLPLALLGITLIFLVSTVIRTSIENSHGGVGVWKNSAFATLLYGLPDDIQKQLVAAAAQEPGTPRTKAKELHIRMSATKDWRISGGFLSPVDKKSKPPPGWL